MLKFGNKEFRNLQEQVKKNMDDILFILQEEGVLNEFGIKVVGQEASVLDMPTVADYKEDNPEWSYGDAFAIGTEEPYELYILTRANGTHPDDYWFNIGEFPAPGPQGPEGPQGEVGPQGPTGNPGANGISPQLGVGNVVVETLESDQDATVAITESGTQANPIWNFNFGIPKGQDGSAVTEVAWGDITGSLANQTDLVSALQAKANASALASYATQVYANNVASNATYQAVSTIRTSANEFAGSMSFASDVVFNSYIYKGQSNYIDYPIELPYGSGTLALQSDIPSLSGYATEVWVSANFLSADTPIGGAAQWGSISGTLSDQTDLMSKFSEYATVSSLSSYATVNDLSSYATVVDMSSAISSVNATIASLNYLSVGALSSETVIPDITGLASEGYVNTQIGNLSSIYAPIGDYATTSDLSSAISGLSSVYASISALSDYATISAVSSAIGALDYASVGALSSETYIPRVGGDNDGSYWTAITLGDDTYSIPQGGVSSVAWGNIEGILEDQTDLQDALNNKVNKEVTSGDNSSYIDINDTVIGLYTGDSDTNSSLETSKDGVVIQANDDVEGQSTQLIVSDGSVTITRDSDSASIDLFDLASMSYVDASISALSSVYQPIGDYATVSALSSAVIDINTTISGLSSIYAPLSDYASQAWVSANFLSSGYIPVVSGYAELSVANTFTANQTFSTINTRNIRPNSTNTFTIGATNLRYSAAYINTLYGSNSVSKPVSQIAMLSDINALSSVYAPINYLPSGVSGYASEVWTFTLSDNTSVSKTILVG